MKIFKNIPPKARLMMFSTAAVSVFGLVAFVNLYNPTKSVVEEIPADSKIAKVPNGVKPSAVGDKSILPEDSPVKQEIESARIKSIEDAKNSNTGFMDKLDLKNDVRLLNDLSDSPNQPDGLKDIDSYTVGKEQIEAEKRKLQERQAVANRVGQNTGANGAVVSNFNPDDFLKQELAKVEKKRPKIDNIFPSSDADSSSDASYNDFTTTTVAATSVNSGLDNDVSVDPYIEQYVSNRKTNSNDKSRNGGINPTQANSLTEYEQLASPMTTSKVVKNRRIGVGDLMYAELNIGVNTDAIGPVRVIIHDSGKVKDAVLTGTPSRNGEYANILLNVMEFEGRKVGVSAVVLDPETFSPALADNVDRHIIERYTKLAAAAAAEGYVEALRGTTTTRYPDGTSETISDRLPKSSDQIASAIGRIGEVLIPKFERDFDRPPTVTVEHNKPIIVMFLDEVFLDEVNN